MEIVQEASEQFLRQGYTATTISSIAKALEMSPGNLTFHYPTKEHLLSELVNMLCKFNWKLIEREADEGISSIMAICLELTAMAGACEDDAVIKDFFISAYSSPLCLEVMRKNDSERARGVFGKFCPDWTDEQFSEAEVLVSGIEFATLMTVGDPVGFETRVSGAIRIILGIYGVPEDIKEEKIRKVFAMDYRNIGKKVLQDFKKFVEDFNEQAFHELIKR